MNNTYKEILRRLINSNCSPYTGQDAFSQLLSQISDSLRIDLDNLSEGQDWKDSLFDGNGNILPLWNESLQTLWKTIKQYGEQPEQGEVDTRTVDLYNEPKNDGDQPLSSMLIDNIRYADAGANFVGLLSNYDKQFSSWVKPEKNVVGEKYSHVRGVDAILRYALSKALLQFTVNKTIDDESSAGRGVIHSQIRLLMPKNSRQVFVEDLDRNFWVLGNSTAGLCAYLFGAGSPMKSIYQQLVNELIQLWENVLSLWILIGLSTLKPSTDIHVELFFVPNSSKEPYKKYDDFTYFQNISTPSTKARIIDGTVAYARKYQNSNCVMFPCIRKINYEKNYFSEIYIPFVIFIMRNEDGTEKVVTQQLMYNNSRWIEACPTEFKSNLWCSRETEVSNYIYYPAANIGSKRDESFESHKYFYGMRPEITIGNKRLVDGEIELSNITITFTDVIGKAFNKTDLTKISYNFASLKSNNVENFINNTSKNITRSSAQAQDIVKTRPNKGYYLGECPSSYGITVQGRHFSFVAKNSLKSQAYLIKIGQYLYKNAASPDITIHKGDKYLLNYNTTDQRVAARNSQTYLQRDKTNYLLNFTPYEPSNNLPVNYFGARFPVMFSKNETSFWIPDPFSDIDGTDGRTLILHEDPSDPTRPNYQGTKAALHTLGTQIIVQYLQHKKLDNITYFMAAVGCKPWHNSLQHYWHQNLLTHVFRFIPHRLIYLWRHSGTQPWVFQIDGQDCYLETLGFVGKNEEAYGGTSNFISSGGTTWRLPELRPAYDNKFDNYVELRDDYDSSGDTVFIDMAPLLSSYNPQNPDPLTQAYIQEHWNDFTAILNTTEGYETYSRYMSNSYQITDSLLTLSGLWCVYDGNTNFGSGNNLHTYRNIDRGSDNFRQVGDMYFTFSNSGTLTLPMRQQPVIINNNQYYAHSRPAGNNNYSLGNGEYIVNGTEIMPNESAYNAQRDLIIF